MKGKEKQTIQGQFLVLETDGSEEKGAERLSRATIHGPFKTMRQAEQFILNDADDTYMIDGGSKIGRDEDWGSTTFICEIKSIVKAVPDVRVSMSLMNVEVEG